MPDLTPASSAPETTIWTGSSSQWKNFWAFVSCLLVIPIPWAIWRYLLVKTQEYKLTTERLLTSKGVFNRVTETLELYRIRDLRVTQPFFQRMVGLENIELITTDTSTPVILLDFLPKDANLPDQFRHQIETCRVAKRVREVDFE